MSDLTVRAVMLNNQIKQLSKDEKIAFEFLKADYKIRLSCGMIHRMAFELAQLEIDIELENKG